MSKTKELIDLLKWRSSGVGQAPDYLYKEFFQEVQSIIHDPKWLENSNPIPIPLKEGDLNLGDIVEVIKNDLYSVNKIGDIGIVSDLFNNNMYKVMVPGRSKSGNWHPYYELKKVTNQNK